jgi:hypothetical protein
MSTSPQLSPAVDPKAAVSFGVVLDQELDEIDRLRQLRGRKSRVPPRSPAVVATPEPPTSPNLARWGGDDVIQRNACDRADRAKLVGLAFSGGGIRSATFNLGILEALAAHGLLGSVDYLSTVSGGGYIGSWLAGCIRNLPPSDTNPAVNRVFLPDRDMPSENNEPLAIHYLRKYSNYLTPRLGLLGADTWTSIAIYLRNLLLNLIVIVGAIAVVVLSPALVFLLTYASFAFILSPSFQIATLVTTGVLFAIAVAFIALNLITCRPGGARLYQKLSTERGIQLAVGMPVSLGIWLATIWFVSFSLMNESSLSFWAIAGLVANCAAWALGSLFAVPFLRKSPHCRQPGTVPSEIRVRRAFWRIAAIVLSGLVGGLMLYGLHRLVYWVMATHSDGADVWDVVTWTPPALLTVLLITLTLQIGIARHSFSEEGREWFGRLGAWLMIFALLWIALFLIASPRIPSLLQHAVAAGSVLGAWLLSTVSGLWAGNSPKTGDPAAKTKLDLIAKIAPYIFVCGLLVGISLAIQSMHRLGSRPYPSFPLDVAAAIVLATIAGFVSTRLDLNLFSMHLLYRNRLVRCYLGASRPQRSPQPFTGFDPEDDFYLAELTSSHGYAGPYHIFNAALNLVHGSDLAWQERKAESFVMTPLYCGFDLAGVRKGGSLTDDYRNLANAAYRRSEHYAYPSGGLYVGSAVAISGAAASPNMGYHSSPAVTFLLTVFNIRLGWWLGNPRHKHTWQDSSPRPGLLYLVNELLGLTDDRSRYVYLSDGGHFENLGIYELVRRRCRLIIACDASQDRQPRFDDLGSAIEKCRTDFGVKISGLDLKSLCPGADGVHSAAHYAIGIIDYGQGVQGTLLYIKASLTGGQEEPVDVLNYRLRHADFPHESTGDQWFSESQFESYRQLGECIGSQLFQDKKAKEVLLPLAVDSKSK